MKPTNEMDQSETELFNYIELVAGSDGDSYRDSKNAIMAVDSAFYDYMRDKRNAMFGDFKAIRETLIASVSNGWNEE